MFKKALSIALAFIGFSHVAPVKPIPKMNNKGHVNSGRCRGRASTKRINKSGSNKPHKWDFVQRTSPGMGWFVNRTTGEWANKKISDKNLSTAALIHFGLAGE